MYKKFNMYDTYLNIYMYVYIYQIQKARYIPSRISKKKCTVGEKNRLSLKH